MGYIVENIGNLHIIIIAENERKIQYNSAVFRTTSLESVKCSLALRKLLGEKLSMFIKMVINLSPLDII